MNKSTFQTVKTKDRIKKIIAVAREKPLDLAAIGKATGVTTKALQYMVAHMIETGVLVQAGKQGNSFLYQSIIDGVVNEPQGTATYPDVQPFYDALALPMEFFAAANSDAEVRCA